VIYRETINSNCKSQRWWQRVPESVSGS